MRGVGIVLLRSIAAAPCTLIIQRIIDRPLKEGRIDGVIELSLYFIVCLIFHFGFSV